MVPKYYCNKWRGALNLRTNELKQILSEMTLSEKVGQLVQLTPDFFLAGGEITGPMQEWQMSKEQLFQIGSVLGTHTSEQVMQIQETYLEKSRLKIPLVFMADVIHGYESIYPIPLALASTFSPEIVEEVAQLSAKEATQAGVHVTFSPMGDHVMDARWGRVLESNGEDPTLSAALTRGYVRGYQGENLSTEKNRLAACVKHFVGYGAAQGGRDYNTVDLSHVNLYQNYLPAFQAAIEEGVELVMTSFNTMDGIPVTGNKEMVQKILRGDLNFEGVVISDWAAVVELIAHRVAKDKKEAASLAFSAGIDMDMMSDSYQTHLAEIVLDTNQQVALDNAVFRILTLKNKLGLFEDPYRGLRELDDNQLAATKKQLAESILTISEKTPVLLKNDNQILPLKVGQKVALIGPKASSQDILGAWSWIGDPENAISLASGLQEKSLNLSVLPMEDGQAITDEAINQALILAKENEVVILAIGETSEESGEAASLAQISLSRNQEKLVQAVAKVNPNIAVVLFNGRPLDLSNIVEEVPTILEVWFPGSQGGRSIANLLMGEVNPEGKLPMSFPRSVGQLPLSYLSLSTGRPLHEGNKDQKYISRYMDEGNDALFPFGHGLSYSQFECVDQGISHQAFREDETIEIRLAVKNNSQIAGGTTVQLYIEDLVTKVARPMKELKQWQKVYLEAFEEKEICFKISTEDLFYVHHDLSRSVEPGEFNLYVGLSSQDESIKHQVVYTM